LKLPYCCGALYGHVTLEHIAFTTIWHRRQQ